MECGFPRKFKMFSEISKCSKWCASTDDHVHGDGKKCVAGVDTIFHARTNKDDATIPTGKCVLLAKNANSASKCNYLSQGGHLEMGEETTKTMNFASQKSYLFKANPIADGIITIVSDKNPNYLQADKKYHHVKANSKDECDPNSHFFVEEVNLNDPCDNEGKTYYDKAHLNVLITHDLYNLSPDFI